MGSLVPFCNLISHFIISVVFTYFFFLSISALCSNNMLEVSVHVKMLLLLVKIGGEGQELRYPPCPAPEMSLRLSPFISYLSTFVSCTVHRFKISSFLFSIFSNSRVSRPPPI